MGWFWVDYLLGEGRLKWSYCQYHAPTQGFQASNNTYLRPCYILHPVCDKRNMINMYIIYLHVYVQYKHILYIYIYTSLVFMTWGATKRPIWKCLDVKPKSSKLWPSKASWLQILLWWLPEELHMCSVKLLYMKMSQTIWDAFIHAIANYFWKHSWPVGSVKRITCLSPSKGSKHQSILLLWSQLAKMCFLKTLVPPYISGVPSYLPEEPP